MLIASGIAFANEGGKDKKADKNCSIQKMYKGRLR